MALAQECERSTGPARRPDAQEDKGAEEEEEEEDPLDAFMAGTTRLSLQQDCDCA